MSLEDSKWTKTDVLPNISGQDIWLKTKIETICLARRNIPSTSNPQYRNYSFFFLSEGDLKKSVRTGEFYPFRNRYIYVARYSFRIQLQPKQTKEVYFQIRDPGAASLLIKATTDVVLRRLYSTTSCSKDWPTGTFALAIFYLWQSILSSNFASLTMLYGLF